MKKAIMIVFLTLIPAAGLFSIDNNFALNPFKNNYKSILDYNRFKTFHQFSFFSVSSKYNSGSYGTYLSTIQYGINNNLTAQLHLGKSMNFNDKNSIESIKMKNWFFL